MSSNIPGRPVYIVDGSRTPFLKAAGQTGPFWGSDLAVKTGRQLLLRQNFQPSDIDEVIVGCVMPSPDESNIARIIALRLGCGKSVPAWTVQRNCASGMQALDNAAQDIAQGRSDIVIAGGTDAMSHAPVLFSTAMANWLGKMMGARSFGQRMQVVTKFRPYLLKPVIALLKGLNDPIVNQSMGQTAENLAYRFNITREEMDEFSLHSHQRLMKAFDEGWLDEVTPIIDNKGKIYTEDTGLRRDSSMEKLAKLKPFFDRKFGMVTPANSSQITDGAALLVLASAEAVKKHNLPVRAKIVDAQWAALDPTQMGLGPVHAATPIMQRHNLGLNDLDAWEINEAFAAQVLGCVRAWENDDYCKEELGLDKAMGTLDLDKLNIDGGAIATGHPIGASGARIVLHLMNVLERTGGKQGMASICIGGGQGGAMLIERTNKVSE